MSNSAAPPPPPHNTPTKTPAYQLACNAPHVKQCLPQRLLTVRRLPSGSAGAALADPHSCKAWRVRRPRSHPGIDKHSTAQHGRYPSNL